MSRPRLWVTALSHPSRAAAEMLRHKRVPYRVVRLPAGSHPLLIRAAGFPRWTVPALDLPDGRSVQGSLAISRVLDEVKPDPPLFPREAEARRAVEEAERWCDAELQPIPRRMFRWALTRDASLREWMAADVLGWPAPRISGAMSLPIASKLAAMEGGDDAQIRIDMQRLPALLDRVDGLVGDGTIGGEQPNAADFQLLATIRVLLQLESLRPLLEGRPCEAPARRLYPSWDGGQVPQFKDGSAGIVESSR